MMNREKECLEYIKRWYVDGYVVTVRMDATSDAEEYCIQTMVVETLKDLVENPPPESFIEGSAPLNNWIDHAFRTALRGQDFAFSEQQEDAIKNLAFNYWAQGVINTQGNPELKRRIYRCERQYGKAN